MICLQNIIASLYLHRVWYFYIDAPTLMLLLILELHKTQLRFAWVSSQGTKLRGELPASEADQCSQCELKCLHSPDCHT